MRVNCPILLHGFLQNDIDRRTFTAEPARQSVGECGRTTAAADVINALPKFAHPISVFFLNNFDKYVM